VENFSIMVPWPIALLTIFYGMVAALSAATIWQIATGAVARPLLWPILWLTVSAGVMCGVPLLKPWGRALAIIASWLMVVVTLAIAGLVVMAGRPLLGLLATVSGTVHVVAIRYLRRPAVKAYFN
jgi:hypothetical protein